MDDALIDSLIALMRRNGIEELEYERAGERIRLRVGAQPMAAMIAPDADLMPVDVLKEPAYRNADTACIKSAVRAGEIRAPMSGCFYRAAVPDHEPFVEAGTMADAGQTLALLEAMKMLTPIEAETACRIDSIHAENGAMVVRGDLLFTVTPLD